MSGRQTNVNYGKPLKTLMDNVKKTAVQQPDYRGIGGHGPANHGGHGRHKQTSIGIGKGRTVNFRELDR